MIALTVLLVVFAAQVGFLAAVFMELRRRDRLDPQRARLAEALLRGDPVVFNLSGKVTLEWSDEEWARQQGATIYLEELRDVVTRTPAGVRFIYDGEEWVIPPDGRVLTVRDGRMLEVDPDDDEEGAGGTAD